LEADLHAGGNLAARGKKQLTRRISQAAGFALKNANYHRAEQLLESGGGTSSRYASSRRVNGTGDRRAGLVTNQKAAARSCCAPSARLAAVREHPQMQSSHRPWPDRCAMDAKRRLDERSAPLNATCLKTHQRLSIAERLVMIYVRSRNRSRSRFFGSGIHRLTRRNTARLKWTKLGAAAGNSRFEKLAASLAPKL